MIPTSLIVVADRGSLKAYKVTQTPNRDATLQITRAFDLTDAHGRYEDKLTDHAGRFPVGDGSAGRHTNGVAERQGLEAENDRRIFKELADQLTDVVQSEGSEGWSFAAPSSIHNAIVDLLPRAVSDRIVEHVKSDLVKIEPSQLPSHFRSLQPI
ncbi:MAG: host attachment protein [Chthoniobacterales bacterium]